MYEGIIGLKQANGTFLYDLSAANMLLNGNKIFPVNIQSPDWGGPAATAGRETSRWNFHARWNQRGRFVLWGSPSLFGIKPNQTGSNEIYFKWKATAQMQQQPMKSSSIILALTDGKLGVYVHEFTVKQVTCTFQFFLKRFDTNVFILIHGRNVLRSTCCSLLRAAGGRGEETRRSCLLCGRQGLWWAPGKWDLFLICRNQTRESVCTGIRSLVQVTASRKGAEKHKAVFYSDRKSI